MSEASIVSYSIVRGYSAANCFLTFSDYRYVFCEKPYEKSLKSAVSVAIS